MVESVGEVSGSDKESVNNEENNEFNAGSDNGSVNDEVNQTNLNILKQLKNLDKRYLQDYREEHMLKWYTTHLPRGGLREMLEWLSLHQKIRTPTWKTYKEEKANSR
jgi:hypothetical protein